MKFNVLPLSVAAALALSACGGDPAGAPGGKTSGQPAQQAAAQPVSGPAVTGTASIDNLSTLPPGVSLVLRLLDTTDAASVPVVVTESTQPAPNVLPLSFALGYDPAAIKEDRRYGIQVTVQAETLVLYGTSSPIPVLTQGAPAKGLTAELVRGGQPAANVPPGEQAKNDFASLVENIGALRRIHGERLEADVAVGWDAFVEDSGQIRMAREQVDFGAAGSAQFRYAYKGGKPWVVERVQNKVTTLVGWNEQGELLLNEKGNGEADEAEVKSLYGRAEALYSTAAAKR